MKSRLKESGFTLIELLVVLGIFTLIIGVSFTLLSTGRLSVDVGEIQIQAAENARRAMQRISRELRLSDAGRVFISDNLNAATNLSSGSVINFQIPLGSYADELTLDDSLLTWGSAGPIQPDQSDAYLAYSIDAGFQLVRTTYTNNDGTGITDTRTIAQHITDITFGRTSLNSDLIDIEIVGQRQSTSGRTATQTLRSSVKLRN